MQGMGGYGRGGCSGYEGDRGDDKCQIIITRNKNANGDGLSDRRLGVGLCQSRDRKIEPEQRQQNESMSKAERKARQPEFDSDEKGKGRCARVQKKIQ